MLRAEVACAGGLDVHEEEVANCGHHVFHRHQNKKCEKEILEARGGIEPPIMVLQTIALPLGDRATALRSCQFSVISGQLIRKNNQESTELNEIWTGEARRECRFSPSSSLPCAASAALGKELFLRAVQAPPLQNCANERS